MLENVLLAKDPQKSGSHVIRDLALGPSHWTDWLRDLTLTSGLYSSLVTFSFEEFHYISIYPHYTHVCVCVGMCVLQ